MTSLPIYAMEVSRPMQTEWPLERRTLTAVGADTRNPSASSRLTSKALEEADRAAQKRVSFFGHTMVWGMCVLFFAVTAGVFPAHDYRAAVGHLFGAQRLQRGHRPGSEAALPRRRDAASLAAAGPARAAAGRGRARPDPGAPVGGHRPRDSQPDHRGQVAGAADRRGPQRPRERGVREGGHPGARPGRALDRPPAAVRPRRAGPRPNPPASPTSSSRRWTRSKTG